MIKSIIALFTSGILMNPMVLLGMIVGTIFYIYLDGSQIFSLYKKPALYGIALTLSAFYILCFRRVYYPDGGTDWSETLLAIIGGMLKLIIASILMISFISLFDFAGMYSDNDVSVDLDI